MNSFVLKTLICFCAINRGHATCIVHNISVNFENSLSAAVQHIRLGNVIAIPTDTIYGLAADAENVEAVRKLYRIKERDSSKAVAICVHDTRSIYQWAHAEYVPEQMLKELLPGPVTILLKRTPMLNGELNPNDKKIAVRVPKYEFVQKLTAALQKPIALSSANKSGNVSAVTVEEFSYLWPALDAVFNGGVVGVSKAGSTIVDLSTLAEYKIVREGGYLNSTLEVLRKYNLTMS